MSKILKSSTIVPPNLYVERDADRQVEKVLSEMGRPGYVLVARQMGKTNLLINAKRKYETREDVFIYIDLSNTYSSSRECFRSLIDTALETHLDLFKPIIMSIYEARGNNTLEPHQEHHRELRYLLRTITGKLVFILDEVDALTKTSYSDEIFAQIRSLYFSRINFKEAERLTYLLSGVAEPTVLIKDRKISPFNIGQKIYLEDFSSYESEAFFAKTNLCVSKPVIERVYHWANGNPRITWDISSELEDMMLNKMPIDPASVDTCVAKLYLKRFDCPPVDHIRNMVVQDADLRRGTVNIKNGMYELITDSQKSKLYLAGIIGGDFSNKEIKIKNNVIEMALSLDFINTIHGECTEYLSTGYARFASGDYAEASRSFDLYMLNAVSIDPKIEVDLLYKKGLCSYQETDRRNAKIHMQRFVELSKQKPSDMYYEACYVIGVCNYYLDDKLNARSALRIIRDAKRNDLTYLKALFALCFLDVEQNVDFLETQASLYTLLVAISEESRGNYDTTWVDLTVAAKHLLGQLFLKEGELCSADELFAEAQSLSGGSYCRHSYFLNIDVLTQIKSRRASS